MTDVWSFGAAVPSSRQTSSAHGPLIQASVDGWQVNIPTLDIAISQVIPSALSSYSWNPRIGTQLFDPSGLGLESIPCGAGGVDDGVVVVVETVREEACLQV